MCIVDGLLLLGLFDMQYRTGMLTCKRLVLTVERHEIIEGGLEVSECLNLHRPSPQSPLKRKKRKFCVNTSFSILIT